MGGWGVLWGGVCGVCMWGVCVGVYVGVDVCLTRTALLRMQM